MTQPKPTMPVCDTLEDFLDGFADIIREFDITGIALAISVQNGACITTHVFGMPPQELVISSTLMAEYAEGGDTHHTEQ